MKHQLKNFGNFEDFVQLFVGECFYFSNEVTGIEIVRVSMYVNKTFFKPMLPFYILTNNI